MNPNECVLCGKIWHFTYVISVCLINDYSLIANLHIFVYGRAECTSISLECTKVKLLILNNFGHEEFYQSKIAFTSYKITIGIGASGALHILPLLPYLNLLTVLHIECVVARCKVCFQMQDFTQK